MKVYSIGRENGCDITINDRTDVISRRHATLTITTFGKMTIVDMSSNGTYVNGIRIASNVPVPITRKDNISFAHVARLDWNMIPDTRAVIMRWAIGIVVGLLLIVCAIFGFSGLWQKEPPMEPQTPVTYTLEEMEHHSDSLRQHVVDSINQATKRRDSIEKVRRDSSEKRKKVAPTDAAKKKQNQAASKTPKQEPVKMVGGRN